MNYAVIRTGGKQYKVAEGDVITIERVTAGANEAITFSEVLMTLTDGQAQFGTPLVSGLTVSGKVLDHVRGEKIRVAKYKAKVRYRRVTGHRQELSRVQIEAIGAKKPEKKAETKPAETVVEKPSTPAKRTTRKSA